MMRHQRAHCLTQIALVILFVDRSGGILQRTRNNIMRFGVRFKGIAIATRVGPYGPGSIPTLEALRQHTKAVFPLCILSTDTNVELVSLVLKWLFIRT